MGQPYGRQILEHLVLMAGMFNELGIGEVIDRATQQNLENPEMECRHVFRVSHPTSPQAS